MASEPIKLRIGQTEHTLTQAESDALRAAARSMQSVCVKAGAQTVHVKIRRTGECSVWTVDHDVSGRFDAGCDDGE